MVVIASIPIGALVDRFGRLAMMKGSTVGSIAAVAALSIAHGSVASGLLMAIRAFAALSFFTAQAAYVSVLVPKERSVSAVATMGIIGSLAFASAPAFGVWLWEHGMGRPQYLWATLAIALGGITLLWLPKEHDFKISESGDKRLIMRLAWLPAVIFGIAGSLQAGVSTSLAVLAFHQRGIANGAALFTAAALTAMLLRYPSGRMVEHFGPRKMALPSAILQAAGCYMAASAQTLNMVSMAGIALGCAWAGFVPIVLALLFENSSAEERGSVMGIFNFALGLGFALGSALATVCTIYAGGYTSAISLCAFALLIATPIVILKGKKTVVPQACDERVLGTDPAESYLR
jgi:MFS family permease